MGAPTNVCVAASSELGSVSLSGSGQSPAAKWVLMHFITINLSLQVTVANIEYVEKLHTVCLRDALKRQKLNSL